MWTLSGTRLHLGSRTFMAVSLDIIYHVPRAMSYDSEHCDFEVNFFGDFNLAP